MVVALADSYEDVLEVLDADRRQHSLAVGRKVEAEAGRVAPALRSDLVAGAVLHDVGYGHSATGFHPLDGARFLRDQGFGAVVCHLVVHHSASTLEAEVRGLGLSAYKPFAVNQDLGAAHAVLWWADMTTGPQGQDVTVEHRLEEICARYGPNDVVTRFIKRARPILLAAGQSPVGSIQIPC